MMDDVVAQQWALYQATFQSFKKSCFRLELLDEYRVARFEDEFQAYLSGQPLRARSEDGDKYPTWVREAVAAGKVWHRVHIMPRDLTPYLRYEIEWGYLINADAGEDIYLLRRDQCPPLEVDRDFWLFDDELGFDMIYDDRGDVLERRPVTDAETIARYQRVRDATLAVAQPLREFLTTYRQTGRYWG